MEKITHIVFDHDGTLVDTTIAPRGLFSGIKSLLEELRENDIKLYVWTARHRNSLVEILRELAIMDYFEGLSTPDDAPAKPDRAGLDHMLSGVKPKEVLVIGDSTSDMLGASLFGAFGVGVTWGHGGSTQGERILLDHGASLVVHSVEDLKNWIRERI